MDWRWTRDSEEIFRLQHSGLTASERIGDIGRGLCSQFCGCSDHPHFPGGLGLRRCRGWKNIVIGRIDDILICIKSKKTSRSQDPYVQVYPIRIWCFRCVAPKGAVEISIVLPCLNERETVGIMRLKGAFVIAICWPQRRSNCCG